jgi:hypothetical protein
VAAVAGTIAVKGNVSKGGEGKIASAAVTTKIAKQNREKRKREPRRKEIDTLDESV